jgi:hypothetical protein
MSQQLTRRGVVLAMAAVFATACGSSTSGPTFSATDAPTEGPTVGATPQPTPELTNPPTHPPTPTPAPGQTPPPTPLDLRPFLSSGVTMYNLGDQTLYVTVTGVDPDTSDEFHLADFQVEPEQFTRQAAIPLLLRFDFTFDHANSAGLATCTMNVATGNEVDFVAVGNGVVVTVDQTQPDDIAEMVTTTSSLCHAGPTQ